MPNHLHLVVKLSPEVIDEWTDQEVVDRWTSLFKGPLLIQQYSRGEIREPVEQQRVNDIIDTYRLRLADIGWFMKCLNEPIARMANNSFWDRLS